MRAIDFKYRESLDQGVYHSCILSKAGITITILLTLVWVCIFTPFTLAQKKQEVKFEHLSIENNLSQSSVTAIIQDNMGFIWIGTSDGLNKYDGYQITVYRNKLDDPNSLSDNEITFLYLTKAGELIVGTRNQGFCIYNKLTDNFTNIKQDENKKNTLSDNYIKSIAEDSNGILWIGTSNGLNKYDRTKDEFTLFKRTVNSNSLSDNNINALLIDAANTVWVGTDYGLDKILASQQTILHYLFVPDNQKQTVPLDKKPNRVSVLLFDNAKNLWIGTDDGLRKLDNQKLNVDQAGETSQLFELYVNENYKDITNNKITSLTFDNDGFIWIGTDNGGLSRFDPKNKTFNTYRKNPLEPSSLSEDYVLSLYQSKDHVLWVGTYLGGINKWDRATEYIELYRHNPYDPNSLSSNQIRSLYEDKQGIIWIGTVDKGLTRWDTKKHQFSHFQARANDDKSLSNNHIRSIFEDSFNNLWVGTDGGGLNLVKRQPNGSITFEHYRNNVNNPLSLSNDRVWKIFEDSKRNIWVATFGGGLNKIVLDEANKSRIRGFSVYKDDAHNPASLSSNFITTVFEDSKGTLWIGTFGGGLNIWNPYDQSFTCYMHEPNNPNSIGSNLIYSISEDSDGVLWIGAKGNLNRFDPATENFTRYSDIEGLPNNVIMGILEDNDGFLWISTNNGLSKFDKKKNFRNFDIRDGLQSNEFLVGSYLKISDGRMIFGGINGLNVFSPEKIKDNPYIPQIAITGFKIFNRDVKLDTTISYKKRIILDYDENVFSFDFASLNYIFPEKNWHAYKMEGFDKSWNDIKNRRFASYTNLPPGEYTFRVIGSNNNGVWNTSGTAIHITINPPFWRTKWFWSIIFLLIVAAIYGYIKMRERKLIASNKMLEEKVVQRTEEINRQKEEIENQASQLTLANTELAKANEEIKQSSKLKEVFLANTSHEIRTPLNIIIGYTNLLLNSQVTDKQQSYLKYIQTSGKNLLVIINDILDFSKIEAGKLTIENIEFEFREQIDNIINAILVKANEKNIIFKSHIDDDIPQYVFGDPVRLNQIIINLAANSVKFTDVGGFINLHIKLKEKNDDKFNILFQITDTGIGMTQEQMAKIFESFTQASSDTTRKFGGTGLGLAIVKRLVELQEGSIWVDSEIDKGSTFSFQITYQIADGSTIIKKDSYKITKAKILKNINLLIVDDNPVNRALAIDTILMYNSKVNIDEAEHGLMAVEKVKKNSYDIVIMDLQMPEMDGFEATKYIRTNLYPDKEKFPILGMSAHAMKEEREKCFTIGMNDYLTKPFVPEDLFVKLEQLTKYLPDDRIVQQEQIVDETPPIVITPEAESRTYQFLDLTLLNKTYQGSQQKIRNILKLCYTNIPAQISGLSQHYNTQNWKQLRTIAHSLKTSLNYIGLKELNVLAKTIEMSAANEENLTEVPAMITRIEEVWAQASIEIENEIK